MGTFCFDQYDHPLLWCDEKKRLVERKNAEESTKLWNRKKAEEMARYQRDKKEYHEMVVNHCPWGRPGGGAPNLDIRMRNITAEGLHPTPKCSIRTSALPPCRFDVGPGGAQIRSAADRLYITLKDHPSMTFRNKGHLDIELRYKQQPKGRPKMHLEKIVVSETPQCRASKKKHKESHDPWGKAGPGGAPWRNPKTVGSSFMRSLGWTNKELLKELDEENPETAPSEKRTKKPKDLQAPQQPQLQVKQCCPLCSCKCTIVSTSSSEPQHQAQLKKQDSKDSNKHHPPPPTAGPTSNKATSTSPPKPPGPPMPKPFQRICSKKDYRPRNSTTSGGGGGVELVPLLARRRGMHRPISLSSTDVTKQSDANRWTKYDVNYLNDLKRQMTQKRRKVKVMRERETDMCNQHFETFETFWGRPGHGAPKDIKNNKLNLDDLLYGVPAE